MRLSQSHPKVGVVGLLLLVACGSAKFDARKADSGVNSASVAIDDTPTEGPFIDPSWWRLKASLRVVAGQLVASGSELEVTVLDRDGTELCTELFLVESTNTVPALPDPSILVWWSVERGEGSGECTAVVDLTSLPSQIYLGVGALHPELIAVAGRVPEIPDSGPETLNGAYARIGSSMQDIWVFGFAGDVPAWEGTAGPSSVAPLPDGIWTLAGVYGFPLP